MSEPSPTSAPSILGDSTHTEGFAPAPAPTPASPQPPPIVHQPRGAIAAPPPQSSTAQPESAAGNSEATVPLTRPAPSSPPSSATKVLKCGASDAAARGVNSITSPIEVRRAQPSAAVQLGKESNRRQLESAIAQHRASSGLKAAELAEQFGKKKAYIQKRMFYAGVAKPQRKGNGWNAFIGSKTKDYNQGVAISERLTSPRYLAKFPTTTAEWFNMSKSERDKWAAQAHTAREAKAELARTRRTSGLSVLKDASASFERIREDMMGLAARTGMEIMFMAVRGDSCHYQTPQVFTTRGADDFLAKKLGKDADGLATKLELHVLGMADKDDVGRSKGKSKLRDLRGLARDLIRTGLQNAVSLSKRLPTDSTITVTMDFPNYRVKILSKYGVELVGWPAGIAFKNPGSIHRVDELDTLCDAIKSGKCHWKVLDDKQLTARRKTIEAEKRGGAISKAKASRKSKAATSAEFVSSDVEEEGEDSLEKENGDQRGENTPATGGSASLEKATPLLGKMPAGNSTLARTGHVGRPGSTPAACGDASSEAAPTVGASAGASPMSTLSRPSMDLGMGSIDLGFGWGNSGWGMGMGMGFGMGSGMDVGMGMGGMGMSGMGMGMSGMGMGGMGMGSMGSMGMSDMGMHMGAGGGVDMDTSMGGGMGMGTKQGVEPNLTFCGMGASADDWSLSEGSSAEIRSSSVDWEMEEDEA